MVHIKSDSAFGMLIHRTQQVFVHKRNNCLLRPWEMSIIVISEADVTFCSNILRVDSLFGFQFTLLFAHWFPFQRPAI